METINSWKLQYVRILDALKREEGQGFAEYALIFALVVLVAVVTIGPLGDAIALEFTNVTNAF